MKSKLGFAILFFLMVVIFVSSLCACTNTTVTSASNDNTSMFVRLEETYSWSVVYHKGTKVMYTVSNGGSGIGVFTALLNPDGTPMTYKGNNESH